MAVYRYKIKRIVKKDMLVFQSLQLYLHGILTLELLLVHYALFI